MNDTRSTLGNQSSSKHPETLAPIWNNIPEGLTLLPQFLVWSREQVKGKWTKVPHNATNERKAAANDPKNWFSFSVVRTAYEQGIQDDLYHGIGFALTASDNLTAIDLDYCLNEDGTSKPWAKKIIDHFDSYTERSPSGKGIRIFVRGIPPFAETNANRKTKCEDGDGNIEMHFRDGFVTVTGHHLEETPITVEERQQEVDTFCAEHWPSSSSTTDYGEYRYGAENVTSKQAPALTDEQVMQLCRKAKNHEKFARLFDEGDATDYASKSEARYGLVLILAFYTQDVEQLNRLFRQSALYLQMADKWEEKRESGKTTFGRTEIRRALSEMSQFYTPPSSKQFRMTDSGNAERLSYRHGKVIRYNYAQRQWYVYDGTRWRADDTGRIITLAKETVRAIYEDAAGIDDDDRRKALVAWAQKSESRKALDDMVRLCQSEPGIAVREDDWDTDPFLLNCKNGTINLRTGELLPHDPEDMITKMAGGEYNSDDLEKRFSDICPTWRRFIRRIMPSSDIRQYVCRLVGYAATGDVREQILAFLYGEGSNGKSTFLGALQDALGDYAKQAAPDMLVAKDRKGGVPNDIADLRGARFVATVEVEDGQRLAEGLVKQITGGDRIKARYLHKDFFEFTPTHKILLAANHKPIIRGQDNGIWRRVKLVPFTETIGDDEKDKQLPQKLKEEIPGILSWIVRGCLAWQDDGLKEPKEVTEASQEYREEMDILSEFIEDCCRLSPKETVTNGTLYNKFHQWCDGSGIHPWSRMVFNRKLASQYPQLESCKNIGLKRERGWRGISVRDEEDALNSNQPLESLLNEVDRLFPPKLNGQQQFATTRSVRDEVTPNTLHVTVAGHDSFRSPWE